MHGVGEGGNHSTDCVLGLLDAGVDFGPEEVGFLDGESGDASLQHCIKSIISRINELLFNSKPSVLGLWNQHHHLVCLEYLTQYFFN